MTISVSKSDDYIINEDVQIERSQSRKSIMMRVSVHSHQCISLHHENRSNTNEISRVERLNIVFSFSFLLLKKIH
jgi:hypothetical protein